MSELKKRCDFREKMRKGEQIYFLKDLTERNANPSD